VHVLLKREGWACNRKRVQRLWRDEGLHVPRRKRQQRKAARTPGSVTATRPDQVWALDYLFDQTADGRPIKILNVTDEYTREALACHAGRSINADETVAVLESLIETRGQAPVHIRCDNGPELVAETLRDWCRYAGTTPHYIEPGAPWQNPYVESFNGTSAANSSNSSHSTASTKPRSCSKTGDTTTTNTAPTNPSTTKPQQPTPTTGMLNTNPHTHNEWTKERGQVSVAVAMTPGWCLAAIRC
jgi:transposase InsO family protein